MKVAITVMDPTINAKVATGFERCPFFLVVKTQDLSFEAIENTTIAVSRGAASARSAKLIAEKGVQLLFTGSCGPNAQQCLSAAGIGVIFGCSGIARDVIERHFGRGSGP